MKETPLELKFIDQVFYDECTYMLEHIKLAAWTMYLVLKKKKKSIKSFCIFCQLFNFFYMYSRFYWGPFVEAQRVEGPNNEGHKELTV